MNRLTLVIGVSVLALALLAPVADATQVLYRTAQELGADAALVVDGRVTNVRSYWNDTGTKIITEATVNVAGTHKGNAPATVAVVQLGGVVGNVRQTVHGALQWQPGEEVLLFLDAALPGTYQVSGFSQGKYRIERDDRGRAFVQQIVPDGAELVGAPGAQGVSPRASTPVKLSLEKFVDQALGREGR